MDQVRPVLLAATLDHCLTVPAAMGILLEHVPVSGRLVGSGPTLGLGVTNELVIKLRECARPRLRTEALR